MRHSGNPRPPWAEGAEAVALPGLSDVLERRGSTALRDITQPVDGPWGSQLLKRTLSTVATSTLLQVAITAGSVMWAPVG